MNHQHFFTKTLMQWHSQENFRTLPWKQEKDPYKIWLSEIILQQTRAEQGLPYYLKFTESYPNIKSLAKAKDEDVFRLWQGLGYYNRCKNLLITARFIANELDGKFPVVYEEILQLKGIGNYTAAAIASFGFNLPYAVVDGNVNRVLARFFGIEIPMDSTEGKKYFSTLANELLDTENSAAYNQAIMDLGATVCKPQNPLCEECLLRKNCFAFEKKMVNDLPLKQKKIKVKHRYFYYFLLRCNDKIYIQKRVQKDIWQNLYEPFLIESERPLSVDELLKNPLFLALKWTHLPNEFIVSKQKLTHQLIAAKLYVVDIKKQVIFSENSLWIENYKLNKYAFPKTVVSFFKKINLLLDD